MKGGQKGCTHGSACRSHETIGPAGRNSEGREGGLSRILMVLVPVTETYDSQNIILCNVFACPGKTDPCLYPQISATLCSLWYGCIRGVWNIVTELTDPVGYSEKVCTVTLTRNRGFLQGCTRAPSGGREFIPTTQNCRVPV